MFGCYGLSMNKSALKISSSQPLRSCTKFCTILGDKISITPKIMKLNIIPSSEGRKNLAKIIKEVADQEKIYILTTNGHAKVAMINWEILEEMIENEEYGITSKELLERSKDLEGAISEEEFRKEFNL
jgi:PHD/YefM family antitoxin component YafN of YafNO toxin-antitoxin module